MSEQATTPTPGAPPAEPTPATAPAEKTFTQADIDRIVAERLKRQKEQYGDYDTLKAAKEELDQLKAGQLSEQEKLQKRLEKAEAKAAEVEARAAEREQKAQQALIESAVLTEATRLGFADPEDAYLLLPTKPEIGEDGRPVGVAEAVAALAEKKPHLLRQGTTQQQLARTPAMETFNPAGSPGQLRESDEQRRARLYGKRGDVFNPTEAEKRGGGVIWNNKPGQ